MKRQRAERHIMDTAVVPHSNADLYKQIGKTAEKLGTTVAGMAEKAKEVEDLSMVNEGLSNATVRSMEYENQFRIENEGKPRDPQKQSEFNMKQREIWKAPEGLSQQGRAKWASLANKSLYKSREDNVAWGIKQSVGNTVNRINNTVKTNNEIGKAFGASGKMNEAIAFFESSDAELRAFSDKVTEAQKAEGLSNIGQIEVDDLLTDYRSDFTKSYIIGAIGRDPDEGLQLLKTQWVQEAITDTRDIDILVDYAKATIEGDKQVAVAKDWASQREFDNKVATGDLNFDDVIEKWDNEELSPASLKKYTVLAGGKEPMEIETNFIRYNELYMDIVDVDNPDIKETYEALNKAFLEEDDLAVEDYGALLSLISPDYYQAVNKNHKMNAPEWQQGLMSSIDKFREGEEDYGLLDSELASMSKKMADYVSKNPKASTAEVMTKAQEVQGTLIKSKFPNVKWTTEKVRHTDKHGTTFDAWTDKEGNPQYEVIDEQN